MIPGRFLSRFAIALTLSAVSLCVGAAKPSTPGAALAGKADAQTAYQDVKLAELVPASRTGGGRAIFEPRPVRFTARLAQLPSPQKTDYLKRVMSMMGVSAELKVGQRVALDYGSGKPLAAYVEDGAAARIGEELKAGDTRVFYAFHVYNNRYGPALVITTFDDE